MTFDIEVHEKNMVINERLGNYVDKKIHKLGRFLADIMDVRVDLSHIKTARNANDRNVAQITIRGKNYLLRSEESTDDIYSAFDAAMDKIKRRIERYKGKRSKGGAERAFSLDTNYADEQENVEGDELIENKIVKRKKFTMKPMNELEAIEQMNLLGHEDFFLFYNNESGMFNLLYRRKESGYGLIETEIG